MASPKNDSLIGQLDDFFEVLMNRAKPRIVGEEASAPTNPDAVPIGFLDQLKVFEAGVRWVQVKNRLEPEPDTDAFGELARGYHRGARKRGSRAAASEAAGGANGSGA